jgi:hypothetical protein
MTKPLQTTAACPIARSLDAIFELHHGTAVGGPDDDFAEYERRLHERVMAFERELLREKIESADVNVSLVELDGMRLRRVLNSETTITTAAGDVKVRHTLYKDRTDPSAKSVSALKRRLGVIDGFTPHAAALAEFLVTELVPEKAAETLRRIGNMTPSKSTLDRLPKSLSKTWEQDRATYEAALRDASEVPVGTVTVAVSLDGVLAPMEDGGRVAKRQEAAEQGRLTKGPAGYREVGCGTLSFCNETGEMIAAIRIARSPEMKKKTLKEMLRAELDAVLAKAPHLKVVKLADGAKDNWEFLSKELPEGLEILDFYHAAEHLNDALAAVYGEGTKEARRRLEDLRHVLRHHEDGLESVIRSLAYLAKKHPGKKRVAQVLGYFRRNRRRMTYAAFANAGLPIGSGVVEAACKTLVTQRLKRSGMSWSQEGAQAILTPRAWTQSDRFDLAWALLAAAYKADVTIINEVTGEVGPPPERKPAPGATVIPFPRRVGTSG